MANIFLSDQDVDFISRVVATEVPPKIARQNPAEYNRMVGAVVDTIVNRMASEQYGDTVSNVVNQKNQFTKINGPKREAPYGSVENTPVAPDYAQSAVENHLAERVRGVESEIGGSMNYANPYVSDAKNITGWIKPMIDAGALKLGLNRDVHFHGTIPGTEEAPNYSVSALGMPEGNVPAPVANPRSGLLGMIGDVADPGVEHVNAALATGTLESPTSSSWQDMALAGPVQTAMDPTAFASNPVNVPSPALNRIAAPISVAATGDLGVGAGLPASTAVGTLGIPSVKASADMGVGTGLEAAPNNFTIAAPTGLLSNPVKQAPISSGWNEMANPGVLSQAAAYKQFADLATPAGITNLAGNITVGPTGTATNNYTIADPVSVPSVVAPPSGFENQIDTNSVIAGPADTTITAPAQTTQTNPLKSAVKTAIKTATQPVAKQPVKAAEEAKEAKGLLSGLMSKESILGGVAGSLALGPVGGILGGLIGRQMANNGGIAGMLNGPGFTVNSIGAGPAAVNSVYSGQAPVGSQAVASNGAKITAMPGGNTAYTNSYGVTTVNTPSGPASYFGKALA